MPVLYGVFFFMGVSALNGMQFVDRILIMFMPQKYQPDLKFLRHVPLPKVHLFTIIQIVCLAILWVVKSFKAIAIAFPLMVRIMLKYLLLYMTNTRGFKINRRAHT